jgi:hypothetical protein
MSRLSSCFQQKPWTFHVRVLFRDKYTTYARWTRTCYCWLFCMIPLQAFWLVGVILVCAFKQSSQGLIIAAAVYATVVVMATLILTTLLAKDAKPVTGSDFYFVGTVLGLHWIVTPVLNGVAIKLDRSAIYILPLTFFEAVLIFFFLAYYCWGFYYFKRSKSQRIYEPVVQETSPSSSTAIELSQPMDGPLSRMYQAQISRSSIGNGTSSRVAIMPAALTTNTVTQTTGSDQSSLKLQTQILPSNQPLTSPAPNSSTSSPVRSSANAIFVPVD